MNFLALCKRGRTKCRMSGTGPTAVLNQQGEYARLVDWMNEAWMEIQLMRDDWRWMRQSMSFPTVAGQAQYTLAQLMATGAGFTNIGGVPDFQAWDHKTFRNYITAIGFDSEVQMDWLDYDVWRDTYQIGAVRNTRSRPTVVTELPGLGLGLGYPPIDGYTVTGDYFKVATEMTADTDVPSLPAQFHMAIVYKVMMYYGVSESAAEVYDEGKKAFDTMMERVDLQQLPDMQQAGALA